MADRPLAHRIARVLGSALSAIWLFILVAHLFTESEVEEESSAEGVVLSILAVSAIASFGTSFWRRRLGSGLMMFVGCLLCIFAVWTAGRNQWLAVLVSGVPWIAVGVLLLRDG